MRENIFYFKPRKMLALKTQYVLNVHCSARYVAFSGKRSPISISFLVLFMKILRYERAILSCFSPLSSLCSLLTHPGNIGKRWIKISLLEQAVWRCSTILKISEISQEISAGEAFFTRISGSWVHCVKYSKIRVFATSN